MPDTEIGILVECDHCGESLFTVYMDDRGNSGRIFKIKCDYCGTVSYA